MSLFIAGRVLQSTVFYGRKRTEPPGAIIHDGYLPPQPNDTCQCQKMRVGKTSRRGLAEDFLLSFGVCTLSLFWCGAIDFLFKSVQGGVSLSEEHGPVARFSRTLSVTHTC